MKKVIQFLLLFVLSYVFAACSDDEYKDLQIPGKSIEEPVKVTGHVYKRDGTWCLFTDLDSFAYFEPMKEGFEIKVENVSPNISLEEIEDVTKTFTVKLTLYDVETMPSHPYIDYVGFLYHYVADIYEIE